MVRDRAGVQQVSPVARSLYDIAHARHHLRQRRGQRRRQNRRQRGQLRRRAVHRLGALVLVRQAQLVRLVRLVQGHCRAFFGQLRELEGWQRRRQLCNHWREPGGAYGSGT